MTDKGLLEALSDDDTHFAGDLAGGSIGSCRRLSSTCRHDQRFSGCSALSFLLTSKATASTEILQKADKGIAAKGSQKRADLLRHRSRRLNQTIYDETYGTNVRDETDEADGAHGSASTLVARRTRRTIQLSRRSERNALRIFRRSAMPRG